ncbi:TOTE conflict system archaeo-eukaryotic primase domain-containing protein [Alicyclobacillus suci]|uniref:TOTE conflict system archaeo-eukaryotic primase domain-containing protein n=1 Tax=Alicyclobacillus suci TaxID=2816080 RepID=UPI001A8CF1C2|nr:hypothetical protein [Alicyclobacillus suci]
MTKLFCFAVILGAGSDYQPLTDDVIRAHLQDERQPVVVVGLYPLLFDETCWFLALDFDKRSWKDDATAFLDTCYQLNVSFVDPYFGKAPSNGLGFVSSNVSYY